MNISERTIDGITIIDLDGNLTDDGSTQLKAYVTTAIDEGMRRVILNLSRVPCTDSCGLGELISCYTSIRDVRGEIRFLGPNHRLLNLLVITKLITLFETFSFESLAIASFADHRLAA